MIAFATEHWDTGYKDDPRYTQWMVLVERMNEDVYTKTWYPVHQCSDEEFDKFFRIEDAAA